MKVAFFVSVRYGLFSILKKLSVVEFFGSGERPAIGLEAVEFSGIIRYKPGDVIPSSPKCVALKLSLFATTTNLSPSL